MIRPAEDDMPSTTTLEPPVLPPYTAVAPAATKTAGALLFDERADIARCFERTFSPAEGRLEYRGFSHCESSAKAIIPAGSALEILEKYQSEYVAKVKVMDGPAKGEIGYVHETWISPSPWTPHR